MLTEEQVAFYNEHGWLRIPQIFTGEEFRELDADTESLIQAWTQEVMGWTGPWRKVYMDADTEARSKLVVLFEFQLFSAAWTRAVAKPALAEAISQLLGTPNVELQQSTLHAKPPSTGQPFPVHQDYPFYPHTNDRFVDVLVHLDNTSDVNGEIRFLDGSHKLGPLQHVTSNPDGTPCTPHLPTDEWKLEDTVAVPAEAGDVVVMNINTIHGSYLNRSDAIRRMVRLGYRDPTNHQLSGQNMDRTGMMVLGRRPKEDGDSMFRALYPEQYRKAKAEKEKTEDIKNEVDVAAG